MAHRCKISQLSRQTGHRVSHANNKRNHVFRANLQTKRLFIPELNKFVKVKLSTRMIRTIDKIGLMDTLKSHGMTLKELVS